MKRSVPAASPDAYLAALTGWLAFGETLGALDIVGAALVGLALILVRQPEPKA